MNTRHFLTTAAAAAVGALIAGVILYIAIKMLENRRVPVVSQPVSQPPIADKPKPQAKPQAKPAPAPAPEPEPDEESETDE